MAILARYPRRVFAALVLLVLLAGGLILVISNRFALSSPDGSLWLAFGNGSVNRLMLAQHPVEIETFHWHNDQSNVLGIWELVRSQDGSRIAFTGAINNERHIYAAKPDGSAIHPINTNPQDSHLAISPDGSQVVFVRTSNFRSALFITDTETGEERPLTDYTNDLEPDWSPDGTRIVFTSSRDGFQELYTITPDGTDLQRLTQNENLNDLQATYSPDGTQIAYMTNYAVNDGSGEIWVMDADGRNPRQLTHNTLDDGPPVWSPDGNYLAFSTAITLPPDIQCAIFVYDLQTDALTQLTPNEEISYGPIWSPDSEWIAFLTHHKEYSRTSIDTMRRDGSNVQTVLLATGADLFFWLPE